MTHTEAIRLLGPLASLWPVLPPEQRQSIRANMRHHELKALRVLYGVPPDVQQLGEQQQTSERSEQPPPQRAPEAAPQQPPPESPQQSTSVHTGDPVVAEGWANRPRPAPAAQAAFPRPSGSRELPDSSEPQHSTPDPVIQRGWQERPRPEPCRPEPTDTPEPQYHPWPDPMIAAAWEQRPRPLPYVPPPPRVRGSDAWLRGCGVVAGAGCLGYWLGWLAVAGLFSLLVRGCGG